MSGFGLGGGDPSFCPGQQHLIVLIISLIRVQDIQALIFVHHEHHGAGVRVLLAAGESLLLALNVMFHALLLVSLVLTQ